MFWVWSRLRNLVRSFIRPAQATCKSLRMRISLKHGAWGFKVERRTHARQHPGIHCIGLGSGAVSVQALGQDGG